MRTKINLISWAVFLMLLHHMTLDKPEKVARDSYRVATVNKVAYKKPLKLKKIRHHNRS